MCAPQLGRSFGASAPTSPNYSLGAKQSEATGDTDGKVPISFSSLIRREEKAQIHGGGGNGGGAEADGLVPLVGCFLLFTRQTARHAPHHIKHMLRANSKAGGGEVWGGAE